MKRYLNYIKKRKFILMRIVAGLFFLSTSQTIILLDMAEKWNRNGGIGGLLIASSGVTGLLGLVILARSTTQKYRNKGESADKWF